ncbi:RISC-loading complex subunit TARBP2 [Diachasma alloeum]|uniref:RISC-loading complex subunit TARBP2 n=1 Tax=Diachasma alloeum TaxID=454923 RepID=UPI0007383275|nr:RISC-loading complex subunit TARBP2 [Diachasma alloeum]
MTKTAISALQEYLQKTRAAAPCYTEISIEHGEVPNFKIRCECMGLSADGEASNKKTAKHRAAGKMIKLIKEKHNCQIFYENIESPAPSSPAPRIPFSAETITRSPEATINHIGKLNELCASKKMHQPVYYDTQCIGLNHLPLFTVECRIATLSVKRAAHTKKEAKQRAAHAMRELLKTNYTISNDIEPLAASIQELLPAADELVVNIEDLQIQEDPKLAKATERAKTLYPALKKRLGVANDTPKNICIADYHEAFKASFEPQVVASFLAYYKSLKMTEKLTKMSLEVILKRIVDILGVTFETRTLKVVQTAVYIVAYKIKSKLSFTEVGMADNSEGAHVDALHRLIGAIYVMLV